MVTAPALRLRRRRSPRRVTPNVTAIAAYLSAQHHIPFDRVVEIMFDVAGVDLSAGFAVSVPAGRRRRVSCAQRGQVHARHDLSHRARVDHESHIDAAAVIATARPALLRTDQSVTVTAWVNLNQITESSQDRWKKFLGRYDAASQHLRHRHAESGT